MLVIWLQPKTLTFLKHNNNHISEAYSTVRNNLLMIFWNTSLEDYCAPFIPTSTEELNGILECLGIWRIWEQQSYHVFCFKIFQSVAERTAEYYWNTYTTSYRSIWFWFLFSLPHLKGYITYKQADIISELLSPVPMQ